MVMLETCLQGMPWHLQGWVPPAAFEKHGPSSNQSAEVNKLGLKMPSNQGVAH